jgi:2-dehydro-3-deoxyphosphogalactonate aldolase
MRAASLGVEHLKAIRAVLPADVTVHAVGGVGAANLRPWFKAGAAGLGVGGELYQPGDSAQDVETRGRALVAAWKAARTAT